MGGEHRGAALDGLRGAAAPPGALGSGPSVPHRRRDGGRTARPPGARPSAQAAGTGRTGLRARRSGGLTNSRGARHCGDVARLRTQPIGTSTEASGPGGTQAGERPHQAFRARRPGAAHQRRSGQPGAQSQGHARRRTDGYDGSSLSGSRTGAQERRTLARVPGQAVVLGDPPLGSRAQGVEGATRQGRLPGKCSRQQRLGGF